MNANDTPRLLVLGCGRHPHPPDADWPQVVNTDLLALPGVDVVCDLEKLPWPWEDESFDSVVAENILEHLDNFVLAMEEIHRVLKTRRANGDPGLLEVTGPLAGSFNHHTDPTHRRGFTAHTFDFFDPTQAFCQESGYYSHARFDIWKKAVLVGLNDKLAMAWFKDDIPPAFARSSIAAGSGLDLRFCLTKRPADKDVIALRAQSGRARTTHSFAHGVRDP